MSIDRDAIRNGHGGQRQQNGQDAVEQLLTLPELAKRLQLSPKTIRRLRIPCLRIGRALRYRPSDVERFLAARRFHA